MAPPPLTRPEAATVALFLLGGSDDAVHTEDVAVRLESLAPEMFSWQRYRDRLDKELVRVALSDARLKSGLVVGSHSKGWMLTAAGVKFATARSRSLEGQETQKRKSTDDIQRTRERTRLLESDAYARHADGATEEITADETDAFFRLNVYVRGDSREKKITRVENNFATDPELGPLVIVLAKRARERK
jgi:hypothetical protein